MYVIHPFIIYLMSMLDDVKCMFGWFMGISVVAAIICLVVAACVGDDYEFKRRSKEEKDSFYDTCKRRIKICIFTFITCSILFNITPNKNTMMQMAAASLVTVDNVKSSKEIVERVYTDIIDILKGYTETPSDNK
ncbi:MAG: hypothetical protein ACRDCW_02560 [Sarcina sp.]